MMENLTTVSLLDFARKGIFGPVGLGVAREEVQKLLGPPDDWLQAAKRPDRADLWRYGTTELHFSNGQIWLIHTDVFDVPEGGNSFKLDPWIAQFGLPQETFEQALHLKNIQFAQEEYRWEPGKRIVRTAADVCFLFDDPKVSSSPGLRAFWLGNKQG